MSPMIAAIGCTILALIILGFVIATVRGGWLGQ